MSWPRSPLAGVAATLALVAAPADARALAAAPADRFVDSVGVNVHLMHTDSSYWDLARTRAALRYLTVRHVRDGLRSYTSVSRAWFMEQQAIRLNALRADGLKLDALLGGPYNEAGSNLQLLTLAATLPNVETIEATNEWDINGPPVLWSQQLRTHVRRLRDLMRSSPRFRSVPLIAPALARQASAAELGDLSDAVDFGNGHPYAGGTQPELPEYSFQAPLTEGLAAIRLVSGAKPIVATEAGYHTALAQGGRQPPVDEQTAAVYTVRTLLEFFRLGVHRTFLYELLDAFEDPALGNQEAHFGLFRTDGSPKPAATAVRNLLVQLRDPAPAPRGASLTPDVATAQDPTLRTMVFARAGGGFTIALWRVQPVWDAEARAPRPVSDVPTAVAFGRTFAAARVYRPTRGAGPIAEQGAGDRMTVPLGPEPTLVTLDPAASAPSSAMLPSPAQRLRQAWCRLTKLC